MPGLFDMAAVIDILVQTTCVAYIYNLHSMCLFIYTVYTLCKSVLSYTSSPHLTTGLLNNDSELQRHVKNCQKYAFTVSESQRQQRIEKNRK